jgi:tetratricopeptide (TPR) repeat protein
MTLRSSRNHGAAALLAAAVAISGCRSSGPYEPMREAARVAGKAEQLTRQAAGLIDRNPEKAERLLREALTADLYHGPAHNNLGVVYLSQGKHYEAAAEFDWARKLMPGNPDPRMNLALTLERAGRSDEALEAYESALATMPEHLPTVQALVRLQVRSGKTDDQTRSRLEMIAMRGDDSWRDWARRRLIAIDAGR